VDIAFLDRKPHTLRVAGIYEKDDLAGPYTVSRNLYRRTGADMLQFAVFGRLAPHTDRTAALAAVSSVTRKYPNGKLLTRTSYIKEQSKQLDQFVNLMYGLLALAVVIAVFGIANTLSLSVFERTRELGLLRAVGAYRSQVRAAITWESVITALLGTVQGIVIGILLGYAVIYALRDEGLRDFTIPVPAIGVVVAMSLVAGVVAAIRPARRAARLDVLRALARH
jgi:putative ABC transport system permease protein